MKRSVLRVGLVLAAVILAAVGLPHRDGAAVAPLAAAALRQRLAATTADQLPGGARLRVLQAVAAEGEPRDAAAVAQLWSADSRIATPMAVAWLDERRIVRRCLVFSPPLLDVCSAAVSRGENLDQLVRSCHLVAGAPVVPSTGGFVHLTGGPHPRLLPGEAGRPSGEPAWWHRDDTPIGSACAYTELDANGQIVWNGLVDSW